MANNPYTDFPCHKTADYQEETDLHEEGFVHGERSFTCHGFKTLQAACNWSEEDYKREGFTPDGNGFEEPDDMIDHHAENWSE